MTLATEVNLKLSNGKSIPALGLGTVSSGDPRDIKDQVKAAIAAGYRHIDGAWKYGTEKYIGEAIKEAIDEGLIKREDLFVTTKVWPSHHNDPASSLEQSLNDLQLEYVDLLLQHWPVCLNNRGREDVIHDENGNVLYDSSNDFIGFYKNIEDLHLKHPEKIKAIGVSNYSIPFLEKLLPQVKVKPVVNQIELHPQLPQQDLVDYSASHGIIVEAYSPVGSRGAPVLKVPLIQELARKYNVTTNEVATAYHILQGRVVLPRSSNLDRIRTAIRLPPLSKEELQDLYQVGVNKPTRYITASWGENIGFKWWN